APETIEAFVDDKLDTLDRSTVKLHLADCAECSDEVNDLRESLATMKAVSARPETVRRRQLPQFSMSMGIAAAIALVAFVAVAMFVIWKMKSSSTVQQPITVQNQPTPLGSPSVVTPGVEPSPSLGASPNVAENNQPPSEPAKDIVASLKD